MLLASGSGCDKGLQRLVIEGKLAQELQIEGDLYVYTHRDIWLCKRSLWQSPTPKSKSVRAALQRAGDHYQLTFELADAPHGGFCQWSIDGIDISASAPGRHWSTHIARLYPFSTRDLDFDPHDNLPPEPSFELRCGPGAPTDTTPDCDYQERRFDDKAPAVTLRLDVEYDAAYVPPRR